VASPQNLWPRLTSCAFIVAEGFLLTLMFGERRKSEHNTFMYFAGGTCDLHEALPGSLRRRDTRMSERERSNRFVDFNEVRSLLSNIEIHVLSTRAATPS
jgi:hypothetical protein